MGFIFAEQIVGHARPIAVLACLGLLLAGVVGAQVKFDFNSLNLQDRESEAVETLIALHDDGTITPYTLTISADGMEEADRIAEMLRRLPEVGRVKTLRDLVPENQSARLEILDEANILRGPAVMLGRSVPAPDSDARLAAVRDLVSFGTDFAGADSNSAFARMSRALRSLSESDVVQLEALIAEDFIVSLELLRDALSAEQITLENLPKDIIARETGVAGQVRVVALPRDDLRDFAALGKFVTAVQSEFPTATGRPALKAGVGGNCSGRVPASLCNSGYCHLPCSGAGAPFFCRCRSGHDPAAAGGRDDGRSNGGAVDPAQCGKRDRVAASARDGSR